ncbi:ABC transporter permease [Phyllobacterium sophorae]|jgi:peptide/nickel transport system permease protein|uniref:Peptide ABC transporter permease n=1 Tax=Phyllobacterium sophorae TaxID=1520277 RepID=A0A2P7B7G5_9HYPH|nr:ABC transporter permease [Phyllobacterium sophorae]PSH62388.1 peptide ABC transporter permease [Phyllobacterium sophorae]
MNRFTFNGVIGGTIIALLFVVAATGLLWTPFDPMTLSFTARLAPPSGLHLLGTDEFGRDVLSRIMVGARASVWIGVATVCFAVVAGTLIGLLSGYARGWIDSVIMAFNNALLAFPGILLALGLLAVFGANQYGIIFALGIAYTPSMARIVRGAVLSLREKEFIEASKIMGNSEFYTMFRHVLPNCLAPITVLGTSMFGWAILSESALSFLGLGVPPPAPTWGNMLAAGRPFIEQAAWLGFFPGLCIALTLLGINLLGDALRDKLDPRMKGLK